ncbi:hypothetical protein DICPUDRAFT_159667 [Dictyostelium purpureum]|uniref:Dickkopf N-terminal cysteine-rich domain-containing protein n=1 Tax=Dictyostelium purpureum TaxID=5786 RepID=F1A4P2_DICPU|nr:uncharacterized protein DICPUDRAFT_159667 [Dictyostelium purpureum]EGC28839.1 hypothetical protein DICPUDRAFT_159667 [Dictyostelium purpureum]|eukprot:XP_003294639.1 hypothetical protein DICPUDRAFT_159667 [Dictyostelium purpureum]
MCKNDLVCSSAEKQWNIKPTCMKSIKEGESCQNSEQCFLGLKCNIPENTSTGTCMNMNFAQVNHKCEKDIDCSGDDLKCKDSKCIRNNDIKCGLNNPCQYGDYCHLPSRECKKLKKEGESCGLSVECQYGRFCDPSSKKCIKILSLNEGDKCQAYSNDQCNAANDIYCGTSGVCEKLDLRDPGKCLRMDNLCAPLHKCSCTDFKCYPTRLFGEEFSSALINFYNCADKHQCQFTINRFSPDSCLTKNCASEFCKFNLAINPNNNLNCDRDGVKTYCQRYATEVDIVPKSVRNDIKKKKKLSDLVLCIVLIPVSILIMSIVVEIKLRNREKALSK